MASASKGFSDCVMREAREAFALMRGQHEQFCGECRQLAEDRVRGIVCDRADAFDLDIQFCDIFFRTAFRQDPPASEKWSYARGILEVLTPDHGIDVHHCQLTLHEKGELHGMGERRRVRGREISGMKYSAKWEHGCAFAVMGSGTYSLN
jgi:hypothetical protein